MKYVTAFFAALSIFSLAPSAQARSVSISRAEFETTACRSKMICELISNFELADTGLGEQATNGSFSLPYEIEGIDKSQGATPVTATLLIEDEVQPDGSIRMILRIFF